MNKYKTWNKLKEHAPEITARGSFWYNAKGQSHREDGPAIKLNSSDSYMAWFINGELHREDGPAVTCNDGFEGWFLNGVQYTEKEYNEQIQTRKNI